jgi:hypothetical protein
MKLSPLNFQLSIIVIEKRLPDSATPRFYLHRFISTIFSFVSTCLPFSLLFFITGFVSICSVKVLFSYLCVTKKTVGTSTNFVPD